MIKLSVTKPSISAMNAEIELKVAAIGLMKQPAFLNEVSKAVFVILGQRFVLAVDRYSATNPKVMHHVYEWNKLGHPGGRLFVLNRIGLTGGSFITETTFLPSRKPVPIKPELAASGKTGRSVSRRNIFVDKARIMEEGIEINYVTRRVQVFSDGFEPRFIAAGTPIRIANPGGKFVKKSFAKFMEAWYLKNSQPVINSSGLFEKIAHEAAIVLTRKNAGPSDMMRVTSQVVESITAGRKVIV
jgi:hypothetical protein